MIPEHAYFNSFDPMNQVANKYHVWGFLRIVFYKSHADRFLISNLFQFISQPDVQDMEL